LSKNGFLKGTDSDYDIIRKSMNDKRFLNQVQLDDQAN